MRYLPHAVTLSCFYYSITTFYTSVHIITNIDFPIRKDEIKSTFTGNRAGWGEPDGNEVNRNFHIKNFIAFTVG